ncbi:type II toxin-antitoxin system VapB family antitoxin [Mesorhizobium sp. CGMCC 1.15528]|uniref:Type II toxin-antitoxin system VapB family antitoxin n=1 Tax=Mesorhizobium zhangyense TaxID=1776730 RepID=A0A7C9V7D7_9HYPH|nr:type II toxin-antitoxin system VapB family antitoxin [Mesorhizobium zhangyense]NGN41663.1 type II toxin-antitoxin system VapB family antitoxin [Mesorhizobium zhangyense]
MALSVKDKETEQLASALEERLRRGSSDARKAALLEDLVASRRHWAALPVLDARSVDEILGYDENGLPN